MKFIFANKYLLILLIIVSTYLIVKEGLYPVILLVAFIGTLLSIFNLHMDLYLIIKLSKQRRDNVINRKFSLQFSTNLTIVLVSLIVVLDEYQIRFVWYYTLIMTICFLFYLLYKKVFS
jgi:hypothetical protein